jgi:hypothetical protein
LAKGKLDSSSDNKSWEVSEPQKLANAIGDKHSGDDNKQFIRVIRYLKRWKDYNFSTNGNATASGIGLTIAAYNWFSPNKILTDVVAIKYKYNDLQSTRNVVKGMLDNFVKNQIGSEITERLKVYLPVAPYSDLFEKMTNNQMVDLKNKLNSLLDALNSASHEVDPQKACKALRNVLGNDFPIPDKPETGEKKGPAIATASASANV